MKNVSLFVISMILVACGVDRPEIWADEGPWIESGPRKVIIELSNHGQSFVKDRNLYAYLEDSVGNRVASLLDTSNWGVGVFIPSDTMVCNSGDLLRLGIGNNESSLDTILYGNPRLGGEGETVDLRLIANGRVFYTFSNTDYDWYVSQGGYSVIIP